VDETIEFCALPKCHYRHCETGPHWFLDPFIEEEPRLFCPACGKPRWLVIKADEFSGRFSLDVEPRGVWIEPAGGFVSDGCRAQASDVSIEVRDSARNLVMQLWDIRVGGEKSVRERFNLPLPDTCTFGPMTPCERAVCAACGNESWATAELTPVLTQPGDIVWVCRHGHFDGQNANPMTGEVNYLTGPKMLDCLVWAPELFVPKLKWRWWGPPDIKSHYCN